MVLNGPNREVCLYHRVYVQLIQRGIPGINSNDKSMEKSLTRVEEKIELLIREEIILKKRLNSHSHQPRDKPISNATAVEYLNLSVSNTGVALSKKRRKA
jgi:hypothetical protein